MPDPAQGGSGDLATSFDLRADQYAPLRPDYPPAAVDAALPPSVAIVLDLAAGTGKLTAAPLDRGHRVVAVEPLAGMLGQLHRLLTGAGAVAGTAEELPVADGVVDAVTVGQAFHWFDQRRALAEMARVLRPGGTVALLWNHDDGRDPLVHEVEAALDWIGRPPGGSTRIGTTGDAAGDGTAGAPPRRPPFAGHPSLTDPELTEITWHRRLSVDDFIALQHTYSYVIRASARAALDGELRVIIGNHRGAADAVTVPGTCQVWRSMRR